MKQDGKDKDSVISFPDGEDKDENSSPREKALYYDKVPFSKYGKIQNMRTWDKDIIKVAIAFKKEYDKWPTALLASTETYDKFDKYVAEDLGDGDSPPRLSSGLIDDEDDWDNEEEGEDEPESSQFELFQTDGSDDGEDEPAESEDDIEEGEEDFDDNEDQLELFKLDGAPGDSVDSESEDDDAYSEEEEDEFLDLGAMRVALDEDAAKRVWDSYDINMPLDEISADSIPMSYGETFETPLFRLELLLDENLSEGIFRLMYGEGPTPDDGEDIPEDEVHTA